MSGQRSILSAVFALVALLPSLPAFAAEETADSIAIDYSASIIANASSGRFAPYMIGSWNYGRLTQKSDILLDLSAKKGIDTSRRFSWGGGVEAIGGYAHANLYQRYDAPSGQWGSHKCSPSIAHLQQLYGEVKFRGVFAMLGMKETMSHTVDDRLSSGDFVRSCNSRPIPQIAIGFIDFQDIPLTAGWVQILGEVSYGKFTQNGYLTDHYNYYNNHLTTGSWYTYREVYFRTKPSQPVSVMAAARISGVFGGKTKYYSKGQITKEVDNPENFKTFWHMFLPTQNNGDAFYEGSQLGAWDLKVRYRMPNKSEVAAYFEWPWEDGSGMAKRNGWDGIWGVEYHSANPTAPVSGAVIEYVDFANQSGPLHWAPADNPGTTITDDASGGDNYYNNSSFGSYANYGMSMGTPFMLSPLYNLDGNPTFLYNRTRGVHGGIEGHVASCVGYRLLASWQKAWGSGRLASTTSRHNTSMMLEGSWDMCRYLRGLSTRLQLALDCGTLRGNNFGACLTVSYSGTLNIPRK